MMKYDELIKDLRICASTFTEPCEECSHTEAGDCYNKLKRNAADAIEELQKQLREEHAKNLWIPVTERLPEESRWCLVICNEWGGRITRISAFVADSFGNRFLEDSREISRFVTHWMPLPEPPKEET